MSIAHYAIAIRSLDLTTLYREQSRLEREIERIIRCPYGHSQATMREERVKSLQDEIDRRYARG